jgi:hypothetical protein
MVDANLDAEDGEAPDLRADLDMARGAVLRAIVVRAGDKASPADGIRTLAIAYALLTEKAPAKLQIPHDPPGLRRAV